MMSSAVGNSASLHSGPRFARFIPSGAIALAGLCYSTSAAAHAKWFVEGKGRHGVEPYSLSEGAVQFWITTLAVVFVAALVIERRKVMGVPSWLHLFTRRYAAGLRRLAQLALGISLFVLAVRGCLLTPCLGGKPAGVFWLLLFAQAVAGCLLIADEAPAIAATTIAVLAVAAGSSRGLATPFEGAHLLAMSAYLVLASERRNRNRAIWLLRVGLGVSFCTAAFTEKLLDPSVGIQFLAHVDMNFMKYLGFDYSDRLFVLSAGMSELILGLFLVGGLASRMTACALIGFLLASNGYLLIIGVHDDALTELVGHAPILAALFVIALYGKGRLHAEEAGEDDVLDDAMLARRSRFESQAPAGANGLRPAGSSRLRILNGQAIGMSSSSTTDTHSTGRGHCECGKLAGGKGLAVPVVLANEPCLLGEVAAGEGVTHL